MSQDEFYYIILDSTYDSLTRETSRLPVISKIRKGKFPITFKFEGKTQEGPFDSIFELKKKSFILAGITKQKEREKILKNKNIHEITDFFLTKVDTSFEKAFFDSFSHITIGQISRQKVKGVHFYNPDSVRIKEVLQRDKESGVYSARIEILHPQTKMWVEKEEITTFFPDNWSASKVFLECYIAYKTRKRITDKTYISKTQSGVQVKFIIDETDKILTFYPILETID